MASLSIRNKTRGSTRLPRVSFETLAGHALPRTYTLSLVLCGDTLARRLNREYRKKTYTPNVLSFPLSRTEGEIFINVRQATREAVRAGIPVRDRIAHLFVHGCLHLSGLPHGKTMDKRERAILSRASFSTRALD